MTPVAEADLTIPHTARNYMKFKTIRNGESAMRQEVQRSEGYRPPLLILT
jgi:hypothetical protein